MTTNKKFTSIHHVEIIMHFLIWHAKMGNTIITLVLTANLVGLKFHLNCNGCIDDKNKVLVMCWFFECALCLLADSVLTESCSYGILCCTFQS